MYVLQSERERKVYKMEEKGKTGKIEVKYNMNPGPIRKTITVESNAVNYDEGRVALKIKGEVVVKPVVNLLEKKNTSPMLMQ